MLVVRDPLIRKRLNDLARELGLADEEEVIKYLLNTYYGRQGIAKTLKELSTMCNEAEALMETLNKEYVTHCLGAGKVRILKRLLNAVLSLCSSTAI